MEQTPTHHLGLILPSLLLAAFPFALAALCALVISKSPRATPRSQFIASLTLALGSFGVGLFFSAWVGWIGRPFWWAAPAALTVLASFLASELFGRATREELPGATGAKDVTVSPPLYLIPPVLALAIAVASLALQCFDPVFHTDALWYHLTLPVEWVREGGLTTIEAKVAGDISLSEMDVAGYPLLAETFYAIPISYRLPFGAKLMHLGAAMAVVATVYTFLRPRLTAAGALLFATLYLLLEPSREVAVWANTDHFRALFTIGALTCVVRSSEGGPGARPLLWTGGLLAGFAMSTTYILFAFGAGLIGVSFVAGRIIHNARSEPDGTKTSINSIIRDAVIFGALAAAVVAPWLVKNVLFFGDPLYGLERDVGWATADLLGTYGARNTYLLLAAIVGFGVVFRRGTSLSDRIVALYLIGYLALGVFALPNISRYFLPAMAATLMLAGSALAPFMRRRPNFQLFLGLLILAYAMATLALQADAGFYADALRFLVDGRPAMDEIIWHH